MSKNQVPQFRQLLVGGEAIDAAIKSISLRGAKLDRDIQLAVLSCIQHHADHGDVTKTNMLVAAMPKGARVNALREYIEVFSGMRYDEKAKEFKHCKGKGANMEGAAAAFWVDYKPEADYKPIQDWAKALAQLIQRADRDLKELGDKSVVNVDQLAALRKLAGVAA